MPKNDMIEKKIIKVDNVELPGLVNLSEYTIEDGTVRVPGRDKDVPVRNSVKVIPEIEAIFKITRDSQTLQFLQNWYELKETHNVTLIRIDGSGAEFKRELWPNTELAKLNSPAYDASAPTYAQAMVKFLPEDIVYIDAE